MNISMTRARCVGAALITAGLAVMGGRLAWINTRTWVPVDMPVSLSVGQVRTQEFKTNLKAEYIIEIEVQKNISFDTLNCLLGINRSHPEQCSDTPSVVNASWALSTRNDTVARGSTATDSLGIWETDVVDRQSRQIGIGIWGNDVVGRQIGAFKTDAGRGYIFDVIFLADGSALNMSKPRLRVEVHPSYYEGSAFADIPFFVVGTFLLAIGGIVLFVAVRSGR